MKKLVDFNNWKQVKKLSLNDFNRWVISIYQSGYKDGQEAEKEKFKELESECTVMMDDDLKDLLLTVPGVGEKRAETIVEKVQNADKSFTLTFEDYQKLKEILDF